MGGEIQSMTETEERRFAYGENKYKGEKCPAFTAEMIREPSEYGGGEPTPKGPVEIYDEKLREDSTGFEGVVCEETAKEAWMQALWTRAFEIDEGEVGGWATLEYEEGVEIAEELGWL